MARSPESIDDVPLEGHITNVERHDNVLRLADTNIRKLSVINPDIAHLTLEAKLATDSEKTMTLRQAFPLYKKAMAFSVIFSTAIIMEGYDTALIGAFYAFPPFQKKYGEFVDAETGYQIPARWQTGLSNGALVGEILGLAAAGIIVDRFGYKKTMMASLMMMIAFIFIPFFSQNLVTLLIGDILQGVPWGVFQTMTTAYASEVCPVQLRAYLTTYVNLCWVFGQLIATGVLTSMLKRSDQWAYRIPFAIQWMWPVPILIGVTLAPESPWWYVRHNRVDEAKVALRKLTSQNYAAAAGFDVDATIAMYVHTNEIERQSAEKTSYLQCFKGTDLRRTEIVSMVWIIQTLCGSGLMGFSIYFFESAGLTASGAFNLGMGQYALGAVGTIASWFLMSWIGRRTLYCYGLGILTVLLIVIGGLGVPTLVKNGPLGWGIGACILIYTFVYDLTIGPVCYSLVAELSSTRLKAKSIVIARNLYNVAGLINNALTPNMINPTAWGWGGKAGFFWCGICFLCWVWTFFRLPEPKGRTYGELDVLFEHKVPARQFSTTHVDQFSGNHLEIVQDHFEKAAYTTQHKE
ncbi:MFS transporter-15 [Coleophoma cylindrospora]|uniref:MFS transporter-15 n=1 Tax=Coleophoma cylindrospora TaxID=1849047 RepID=A0A3D8SPI0_9HELO|nr:MFS transporter-15 [Coleophoma cylindrospora]